MLLDHAALPRHIRLIDVLLRVFSSRCWVERFFSNVFDSDGLLFFIWVLKFQIFYLFYPHIRKPLRSTRLKLSTFWSSSISLRKILLRDSFSGSSGSSWLSSPYLLIFYMASLLSSSVNLISTPFELTRNILLCWSRVLALYNCFKALYLQLHSLGF